MARRRATGQQTPALEWVAAGVGALIALVVLGTVGWQALAGRDDPVPLLAARIDTVTPAGPGQVATVIVTNASSRTAAGVHVEGVVDKGGPGEETSSAVVDYVPGDGEATAALVFSDPAPGPIAVRVTGYEHP